MRTVWVKVAVWVEGGPTCAEPRKHTRARAPLNNPRTPSWCVMLLIACPSTHIYTRAQRN